MSTSSTPELTAEQIQKLQAKFTQFRILVIGRANAGKTTILRRLCNTTGEPTTFDLNGREIVESSVLDPSVKRGEHNIKNQMTFMNNPGFIFHDSCGFEAGGVQELKLVQEFIKERSREKNVKKQLHVIWYCIPTSDDRPITAAEKKFFNEFGTGLVPVIVLWTKTDSLDVPKIKQLMKKGKSRAEAMQEAPQKAWIDFEQSIHQQFEEFKYPPKAYVIFRKMHEPGADCKDLIEKTTAALSSKELQQLFLSTQQNNIELCIAYGVRRIIMTESSWLKHFRKNKRDGADSMATVLGYFPHIQVDNFGGGFFDFFCKTILICLNSSLLFCQLRNKLDDDFSFDNIRNKNKEDYTVDSISKTMPFILSGLSTNMNFEETTYCAIVAAILGHLSFFLHKESPSKTDSLERAVQIYQKSTCDTSVKQAVEKIFEHENLFKGSDINCALLAEEAVQIALNNLISRK